MFIIKTYKVKKILSKIPKISGKIGKKIRKFSANPPQPAIDHI